MNVVPPGDIRKLYDCSFSDERFTKEIFQYRFNSDDQFFPGHRLET